MPRVIQVIETNVPRGEGKTADDPCRRIVQYHTLDGEFLAERDTWLEAQPKPSPKGDTQ